MKNGVLFTERASQRCFVAVRVRGFALMVMKVQMIPVSRRLTARTFSSRTPSRSRRATESVRQLANAARRLGKIGWRRALEAGAARVGRTDRHRPASEAPAEGFVRPFRTDNPRMTRSRGSVCIRRADSGRRRSHRTPVASPPLGNPRLPELLDHPWCQSVGPRRPTAGRSEARRDGGPRERALRLPDRSATS